MIFSNEVVQQFDPEMVDRQATWFSRLFRSFPPPAVSVSCSTVLGLCLLPVAGRKTGLFLCSSDGRSRCSRSEPAIDVAVVFSASLLLALTSLVSASRLTQVVSVRRRKQP